MLSNLWMLSGIVLSSGQISQIVDQDLNPNFSDIIEGGSGSPDPDFVGIHESKPVLSFTTTAVNLALQAAGLNALAITSGTPVSFYFQKVLQGGVRDTTTAIKMTCSSGMIVPKTLKASQKDQSGAKLTYELHAVSTDGVAEPFTRAINQSLPSFNRVQELFTVGPVSLNNTALNSVHGIDFDFGMNVITEGCDGNVYPTFTGVVNRKPKFKIQGYDAIYLDTFGTAGLPLTAWKVYLQGVVKGGPGRYATSASQHVKLAGTLGMVHYDSMRGSFDKPMEPGWTIIPAFDSNNSSNGIVGITTPTTIT